MMSIVNKSPGSSMGRLLQTTMRRRRVSLLSSTTTTTTTSYNTHREQQRQRHQRLLLSAPAALLATSWGVHRILNYNNAPASHSYTTRNEEEEEPPNTKSTNIDPTLPPKTNPEQDESTLEFFKNELLSAAMAKANQVAEDLDKVAASTTTTTTTTEEEEENGGKDKTESSSLLSLEQGVAHLFVRAKTYLSTEDKDDSNNNTNNTSPAKSLIDAARHLGDVDLLAESQVSNPQQDLEDFFTLLRKCRTQLESLAQDISSQNANYMDPLAFLYYIGVEEATKTPSWKRRQHRFFASMGNVEETMDSLHNALYLATVSYLHTQADVEEALEAYQDSPWELVQCDVSAEPEKPGHFLCVQRDDSLQTTTEPHHHGDDDIPNSVSDLDWKFPWQEDSTLDVLLVVRGTKEMGDMLSDAMLEAQDYRGGKSHAGIQQSGKYLVQKYTPYLKALLKKSNRDKIRLSLVGHSLGAGAAAIAAMEFNDLDFCEAKAIGFGCPAVLSQELSEATQEYVTTVICDGDVVPRMSGATIANLIMDVMATPYSEGVLEDIQQVFRAIDETNLPFKPSKASQQEILDYVQQTMDKDFDSRQVGTDRIPVTLYPPGKCIHFYRDGAGISATYVPCTFFNEIDLCRTLLQDHMIGPGYDRVFHDLMRDHLQQPYFRFPHQDIFRVVSKC